MTVTTNKYKIMFYFYAFCSFNLYGNETINGPYNISNDSGIIRVDKNNDKNCPLDIIVRNSIREYRLDRICMNGNTPNIRSIFFTKIHSQAHIGIIISWYNKHQAEGIDETNFEVKIYKKNNDGNYIIDKEKNYSPVFYGREDGTGDGSYKYNNALAVKQYLHNKYH